MLEVSDIVLPVDGVMFIMAHTGISENLYKGCIKYVGLISEDLTTEDQNEWCRNFLKHLATLETKARRYDLLIESEKKSGEELAGK